MAKRKTKPARKPATGAAPRSKTAAAPAKRAIRKRTSAPKQAAGRPKPARELHALDLSAFPPESIRVAENWLCLACILDVFTRHLKLAPRTAHLEIKRYTPSLSELYGPTPGRPWFAFPLNPNACPYCGSASKWHVRIRVYRIESGKATDAMRRDLLKSLPKADNQFAILEEKATRQHAFFEWLDKISADLDLEDTTWLRKVSQHYLSRKEPKTDWQAKFGEIHAIRRSRRLESGWEIDSGRLFLAAPLFENFFWCSIW